MLNEVIGHLVSIHACRQHYASMLAVYWHCNFKTPGQARQNRERETVSQIQELNDKYKRHYSNVRPARSRSRSFDAFIDRNV